METLLKERFFNPDSMRVFACAVHTHFPPLNVETFVADLMSGDWEQLELKGRMRRTTEVLHRHLGRSYEEALPILLEAAPVIRGFEAMVLPDYVELYGQESWELSLPALKHFTRYSSSEFAIRPFLKTDQQRGLAFLLECAGDDNEHVRRFASEGCRPRLPWAMALPSLQKDPSPILPILERLKADPSEYVRRSVANNLNDISKDHPELVLSLAHQWYGKEASTDKLLKHALRTQLKKGNPTALALFGLGDVSGLHVEEFSLGTDRLEIGSKGRFSFDLVVAGSEERRIRLEYAVDYVKANGSTSRKVFQIVEKTFAPGKYPITRQYSFQDLSTRRHYPGEHLFVLHVNGIEMARQSLMIAKPAE